MMTARRYTAFFSLSLISFAALILMINYLVDPYLMLGVERREGFNEVKVDINEHVRMSKAYHPSFNQWDSLIVGNSRVEMGLDPSHACFHKMGQRAYNLGIPGAGVRRQLEYALNLIYEQPIKRVYLSLDFVDFLIRDHQVSPATAPDWSAPTGSLRYTFEGTVNPDYWQSSLLDHYRALFSLDALKSSLRTIALQSPQQSDRDDRGFNPARDYAAAVAVEGPHALFAQKMHVMEQKYSQGWSLRYADEGLPIEFQVVGQFLEVARQRGIEVTVFTNPFHEQFWELLEANDLIAQHQEWLDLLSVLVADQDNPGIQLWDFSADSIYIHETVPEPGVKSGPLDWFWEPSHYRRQLGDLMIDAMLAESCGTQVSMGKRLL